MSDTPVPPGHEPWKDRWIRHELVDPEELLANPYNARVHPFYQQRAMEDALSTVGWLGAAKVNLQTGHVFDGHMRIGIALDRGEMVPTDYYDMTEKEERLALATLDPIAAMALTDTDKYGDIVEDTSELSDSLADLIRKTAQTTKAATEGNDDLADDIEDAVSNSGPGELIYGYVGWRDTKITCEQEDIKALDELRDAYVGERGNDEGFVKWLIDSLSHG